MKNILPGIALFALLAQGLQAQNSCKIWYVTPDAQSTLGTIAQPTTLKYAVLNATPDRNIIRCLAGSYSVDTILPLQNDLLIDGAYVAQGGNWIKKTTAVSEIAFSGTETIDANTAHVVGLKANGVNNWKLVDLTLTTADASGATASGVGKSVYAVWVKDAQGASLSRIKITAGNASNGNDAAPVSGSGGGPAGASGPAGGNRGNSCDNGSGGTVGNAGSGGATGGTAGSAGTSGGCNVFNCDKVPGNGGNGGTGANGADGNGFAAGDRAVSPAATGDYYVPQVTPQAGENGRSGASGGSGGGAARGSCCTCSCGCDDNDCGDGGAGGQGGNGGLGGNGGFDGGGSFALYVAGTSQLTVNDCELNAGNAGLGGNGTAGQAGTNGSAGAPGLTGSRCGVNYSGGAGGQGGNGGAGGRGRDGANGLAQGLANTPSATVTVNGNTVANGSEISVTYFNTACTNSEINITKTAGSWTLPSGASYLNNTGPATSSYTNASNNAIIVFAAPGAYTLNDQTTTAKDFVQITQTRTLPVIGTTPASLCQGYGINLGTSTTGTEYDWIVYSMTVNNVLFSSTQQNPGTSTPFNTQGSYVVRLRVKDACCGWSAPVYKTFNVTSPDACLSVEEFVDSHFSIFPNPMTNELVIRVDNALNEAPTVRLLDASGRVLEVKNLSTATGSTILPVSQLANGLYILELSTPQGVYTKKLIKQ